jgi:hypothetical protein
MCLVDHLQRSDTNRATGPVDELNLTGQQAIDPILHDAVSLSAADFHQDPGAVNGAVNLADDLLRDIFAAVFVEIFHGAVMRPA